MERLEGGVTWKYRLLKTVTIKLSDKGDYFYCQKLKLVYTVEPERADCTQFRITCYDMAGYEVDSRVYSGYYNSFTDKDGFCIIKYYSYPLSSWVTGRLSTNAGITDVHEIKK